MNTKERCESIKVSSPLTSPGNIAAFINSKDYSNLLYIIGDYKTDVAAYMLLAGLNHESCTVSATKLMIDLGKYDRDAK